MAREKEFGCKDEVVGEKSRYQVKERKALAFVKVVCRSIGYGQGPKGEVGRGEAKRMREVTGCGACDAHSGGERCCACICGIR